MSRTRTRTHCKNCGVELNDFNCNWVRTSRHSLCKSCQAAYVKEWRRKKLETNPSYMIEKHWKSYGVTPEQYNEMMKVQENKCAICNEESERNLCIDHDHETGEI